MNKIRTLTSRIDSFMTHGDLTNSPSLQMIYRDYCEGIQYINKRLSRCEELLSRGDEMEAVLSAEQVPSLYELVPVMQLPIMGEFLEVCRLYEQSVAEELKMSVYSCLEQASSCANDKEKLFAELRKLSRTHGTMETVVILRKIIKLEPENPEWVRQQRQAEAACLQVLIQQAQQAIVDVDFPRLEELEEILSSHEWAVSIPDVVINKIHRVLEDEHQRTTSIKAKEVLENIEKAYANNSLSEYDYFMGHWKSLCVIDRYLPSDDENRRVAVAESFFSDQKQEAAEEEEYNSIMRQLNAFIMNPHDIDLDEMNTLYNRLATLNKGIPENVQAFVREKNKQHEAKVRNIVFMSWLRVKLYAFFAMALMCVFCAGIWFVYNRMQLTKEFANAVSSGEYAQVERVALTIRKSIFPYAMSSRSIRGMFSTYEQLKKQRDAFEECRKKIEDLFSKTPDQTGMEQIKQNLVACQLTAKYKEAKTTLEELKKRYDAIYIPAVRQLQEKEITTELGYIWQCRSDFEVAIEAKRYVEADGHYKSFEEKLRKLNGMTYFKMEKLSPSEKSLLSHVEWLLLKQKRLLREFDECLSDKTFDATLEAIIEKYKDNELLIHAKNGKETLEKAKLPVTSELIKRCDIAKNDVKVRELVSKMESLKKEFEKALGDEKYDEAETKLKELEQEYSRAVAIKPIGEDVAGELIWFNIVEHYSKRLSGWKLLREVRRTLVSKISTLEKRSSQVAILDSIEDAKTHKVDNKHLRMLERLEYQIKYLVNINSYQQGIQAFSYDKKSAIWDYQAYPYFRDVAQIALFEAKDRELFGSMKAAMGGLHTRYDMEQEVILSYRYGGIVHIYRIPKYQLEKTWRSEIIYRNHVYRFDLRDKIIQIDGNTVSIIDRRNGRCEMTHDKVIFLAPDKYRITREKLLSSSHLPHQILVSRVRDYLEELPETLFSERYYKLFLDLQVEDAVILEELLMFYTLLLEPIKQLEYAGRSWERTERPFFNSATRETFSAISEIMEQIDQWSRRVRIERSLLRANEHRHSYRESFKKLDFSVIERFIKIAYEVNAFWKQVLQREYRCIGTVINDEQIVFLEGKGCSCLSGEVLIFDNEGKTILAGKLQNGRINWNKSAFENVDVSLVFVPVSQEKSEENSVELAADYKRRLSYLGVGTPVWPEIFPSNVR